MTPSPGTLAPPGAPPDAPTSPPGARPGEGEGRAPDTDHDAVPVRAEGVELLGAMAGSGYKVAPLLVRRADGQTLQLTPVLHEVLDAIDDRRTVDEVAAEVTHRIQRAVDADTVVLFVDRLRKLGLLRAGDGSQPVGVRANPLLSLRFRWVASNPRTTRRLTSPFLWLFRSSVVFAFLAAFATISWWLASEKGLGSAVHEAMYEPTVLLLLLGLTIVSAGFHEIGHATACRYGGARPGAMGAALYLVWPAFYTDVTDAYRLGRRDRLRVDLGGLYFNAIFSVLAFVAWAVTSADSLLLIIPAQQLQMLRQLIPLVRFDGYHVLADVVGVPDLFARIKPTLLGLWPTRWRHPEATVLKPWARAVVTLWVLTVVPFLALTFIGMALLGPRLLATALDSARQQWESLLVAWGEWDLAMVVVRAVSIVAVAIPAAGVVYLAFRIGRRNLRRVRRWTGDDPVRRAIALLGAALLAAALSWVWWPNGQYEPIQSGDRMTVDEVLAPEVVPVAAEAPAPTTPDLVTGAALAPAQPYVAAPATAPAPPPTVPAPVPVEALPFLPDAPEGAAPEVTERTTREPSQDDGPEIEPEAPSTTIDEPPPSSVPDETDQPDDPDWPFPFDPPPPAGEGDTEALAVNTEDGTSVLAMAYELVWVTGELMDEENHAYAIASCEDCTTVAVAFQVLIAVGQVDTVIPQNLALAVNYECERCTTRAIAVQLVLSIAAMPDEATLEALSVLWSELDALQDELATLTPEQVHARLVQLEIEIIGLLRPDLLVDPEPPPTTTTTTVTTEAVIGPPATHPVPFTTTTSTPDPPPATHPVPLTTTTSTPDPPPATHPVPLTTTTTVAESPASTDPEPTTTTEDPTATTEGSTTTTTDGSTTTTSTDEPSSTTTTSGESSDGATTTAAP